MIKIGSHVGMNMPNLFLGSVQEAVSYGANTFMVYTGAPQNTRRTPLEKLRIEEAQTYMQNHQIDSFVVHAPYLINLANSVKPEIFRLGVEFLISELQRTVAMGSHTLILHPGSHVGAGSDAGINKLTEGLNEVLSAGVDCNIALETMSGKGSEIGQTFEELARIYDGVKHNEKLRVCFDTCHIHDAGYPIVTDPDAVWTPFDRILGMDQIAVLHINDSLNTCGSHKDRHANIGHGMIGYGPLHEIVHMKAFDNIPMILETPWIAVDPKGKEKQAPYQREIAWLREP